MPIDLQAPVSGTVFTAFDFETTGLYPASDRIIELGAVRFRGDSVLETFESLVDPGIPVPAAAAAVSGIRDADLVGAPGLPEVLPGFLRFIGDSVLVAHNAPFDMGFLRAALDLLREGEIGNRVVDTQQLAIRSLPRRKSYGLQNLASELGLSGGRAHRALDDAMLCMRLFGCCVAELSFMGDLSVAELLSATR